MSQPDTRSAAYDRSLRLHRNPWLQRLRSWWGHKKGFGGCYRCGATWDWAVEHATEYAPGRSCFPLCSRCWCSTTPESRIPYYDALVNEWIRQTPSEAVEYERRRILIREAVVAGG